MKNQKIIIILSIFIIVGLLSIFIFKKDSNQQEVSTEDPVDIVTDFYKEWEDQTNSTSTNPYDSGLSKSGILSASLQAKLEESKDRPVDEPDPVLCKTNLSGKISTRKVYETEDEIQILITSKDKTLTEQAIYTLKKLKKGWYINDITCSPGEFAVEVEFSFDRGGKIVKGSSLESGSANDWYLVFEEDGQSNHSAKLIFGSESMCTEKGENEKVCSTEEFSGKEYADVSIKGQMTEFGVEVEKVDFK